MSYIYKLTDCNGLNYYGSSVNPDKRFKGHKCSGNLCSSNKLDRLSMVMEIIEELPESYTADDVLWRERWYFDNFECVNQDRPIVSSEEMKEYHREYKKVYNENPVNKESNKKSYEANKERRKEHCNEYCKVYDANPVNKEKRRIRNKERYQNNKEKLKAYSNEYRKRQKEQCLMEQEDKKL